MAGLSGGADQDRTGDLLNAIQALSQLSYSPTRGCLMILKTPVKINTGASGLPVSSPGNPRGFPPRKARAPFLMFAYGQSLRRESFSDFAPRLREPLRFLPKRAPLPNVRL